MHWTVVGRTYVCLYRLGLISLVGLMYVLGRWAICRCTARYAIPDVVSWGMYVYFSMVAVAVLS